MQEEEEVVPAITKKSFRLASASTVPTISAKKKSGGSGRKNKKNHFAGSSIVGISNGGMAINSATHDGGDDEDEDDDEESEEIEYGSFHRQNFAASSTNPNNNNNNNNASRGKKKKKKGKASTDPSPQLLRTLSIKDSQAFNIAINAKDESPVASPSIVDGGISGATLNGGDNSGFSPLGVSASGNINDDPLLFVSREKETTFERILALVFGISRTGIDEDELRYGNIKPLDLTGQSNDEEKEELVGKSPQDRNDLLQYDRAIRKRAYWSFAIFFILSYIVVSIGTCFAHFLLSDSFIHFFFVFFFASSTLFFHFTTNSFSAELGTSSKVSTIL